MKVLHQPPQFKPIPITCPHCDAQLIAELGDFKRNYYSDFRESWDYATCECPCCGGIIRVEKEKFPKHLYEKMTRKP